MRSVFSVDKSFIIQSSREPTYTRVTRLVTEHSVSQGIVFAFLAKFACADFFVLIFPINTTQSPICALIHIRLHRR